MDITKELGIFFGIFLIACIFIWFWYSYVMLFGTGFILAMTVYTRNLPIKGGEISAKNGEQPTGKVTKSSYSFQSPKDKEDTPSITSYTTTSVIGGRRSSGPKIEEITDSTSVSDASRRFSQDYTVEEGETVVERRRSSGVSVEENVKRYSSILKNSNKKNTEQERRPSGPQITDVSDEPEERLMFSKTSKVTSNIPDSKTASSSFIKSEEKTTQKKVITRGDSVKALQHKFQQATVSSSLKQTSVERTDSKGSVIERKEMRMEESTLPTIKNKVTQDRSEVVQITQSSRSEEPTSFLDNKTKVTGVQDILTRMRNADLVTEQTDTTEDAEARALLNKFLGASVILQGMEQGMRAAHHHSETEDSSSSPASAALVIQAEKQLRVKGTSSPRVEDDIDDITDEKQLRILLDACSDYEGRRKLRARLRTIMAEQKGTTEDTEESHGEFVGLRNVDDSGIESGEDLKVNPEVMKEVEDALGRLEGIIDGLDPSRRQAVSKLVNSLQSCLRLPPKRRVTIGVSTEELAAARKWLEPPLEEMTLEYITYRPIAQRAGYFMEPAPQNATVSYISKSERSLSDSGSLQDYDPSLVLFTPEESVQIAVHKAAIKKQISQEEKRRDSSDDGDVSSGDEETAQVNKCTDVSSAQRLLQLATESAKKNPSAARFHNRSSKKLKLKRANTIDIPKPANFYEYSSGDEYGASADEVNNGFERRRPSKDISFLPPTFEPKTENDMKFLAFLKQVNDNQPKVQTYNPSARGGKHWSNRFSSIKTAFEHIEPKQNAAPSPAKMFWQNSDSQQSNKDQYKNKLPWTVKTNNDGVVVGSLTVAKPGHVNNFNHAPKSAFKPIEKKPVSTVSGTVKQIATQKFSADEKDYTNKIEKPSKKISHGPSYINPPSSIKQHNSYHPPKQCLTPPLTNNKYCETPYLKSQPNRVQYTNSKTPKKVDQSPIVESSRVPNGTHAFQNQYYPPDSQNKMKTYVLSAKSSSGPEYNITKAKQDYVTKSQQNTMNAKKQFMESNMKQDIKIENKDSNTQHLSDTRNVYNNVYVSKNNYKSSTDESPSSYSESSYSYPQTNFNYTSTKPEIFPKPKMADSHPLPRGNILKKSQNTDNYPKSIIKPKPVLDNFQKFNTYPEEEKISHSGDNNQSSLYYSENINVPSPVPHESRFPDVRHASSSYSKDNIRAQSPVQMQSTPHTFNYTHYPRPDIVDSYNFPKESNYTSHRDTSHFCDNQHTNTYSTVNEVDSSRPGGHDFAISPSVENKPYTAYIYSSNNTLNSSVVQDSHNDFSSNYCDKSSYLIPSINSTPPLMKEEPSSPPSNLPTPNSLERLSPHRPSNNSNKSQIDPRYLSPSYHSMTSSQRFDDDEISWGSTANGDGSPLEEKAVSRVMGQAQCQQAVTVNNRTRRRFDADLESELKVQLKQSAQKKSLSPSFPNVIQKSESWHQMVKEQMQQAKQAPPLPKISKAKSSHSLAQPKQFEAALTPDTVTQKKITVSQYLQKQQARSVKSTKSNPKYKSTNTLHVQHYDDDDLDDVDEIFESIFQEASKKRNSK